MRELRALPAGPGPNGNNRPVVATSAPQRRSYLVGMALLLAATHATAATNPPDSGLYALRAILLPVRNKANDLRHNATGAARSFPSIRQSLQKWMEGALVVLPEQVDAALLEKDLIAKLRQADLTCPDDKPGPSGLPDPCAPSSEFAPVGFVEPPTVKFLADTHTLLIRSGPGVECGWDESAYAYEWREHRWQLSWKDERTLQPGKPFWPSKVDSVEMSPQGPGATRLVLSLREAEWCQSNYQSVTYALSRLHDDHVPPTLLIRQTEDDFRDDPPSIRGSVSATDALIEFKSPSPDIDNESPYQSVRHFQIDANRVTRAEPFALRPRSFVEDWIKMGWDGGTNWIAPTARGTARRWHDHFATTGTLIHFPEVTKKCRGDASLYQVGIESGTGGNEMTPQFFLIRRAQPYHFQIQDISSVPWPSCDQPDLSADAFHTLFHFTAD